MATRRPDDADRFDTEYYHRFYEREAVHDADHIAHLATAVHQLAAWWDIDIASVLDVGAGTGLWRDWYRTNHPEVSVRSVDISAHACAAWGHERRDIAEWRARRPVDLVICHGVLHYLDDERAERAIENLCASTAHLLYLEIPTTADLLHVVDPDRTDMDVHRRTGAWYRTRLDRSVRQVGAGLWITRSSTPLYELEAARR